MKVLVTGATGFFGPAILARLAAAGHEAVGAARRSAGKPGIVSLDITSPENCRAVIAGVKPDAVVHAAALAHVAPGRVSEDLARRTNTGGAANMIEASIDGGVSRFVFISSVMVYGDYDLPQVVRETDAAAAHGVYSESKIRAENACLARQAGTSVVILRMATMYSAEWVSNLRKRVSPLTLGRPLYFSLDPAGRRYSLCSRRNGAEAVLWAVEGRLPPGIYNVADDYTYSQAEIRRAVERADGHGPTIPIPLALPKALEKAVAALVPIASWREAARSRYWKFCEANVYSSAKLNACGLTLPADLLDQRDR